MTIKSTNEMDELLKVVSPEKLCNFYDDNRKSVADDEKAFYYYFTNVLAEKRIKIKDVCHMACFSESYGRKLISMEKHTKDRDAILRLCIAGHFHLDEINSALKHYNMSPLYSKNIRDICIIVQIHNRNYDILKINDALREEGLKEFDIKE